MDLYLYLLLDVCLLELWLLEVLVGWWDERKGCGLGRVLVVLLAYLVYLSVLLACRTCLVSSYLSSL